MTAQQVRALRALFTDRLGTDFADRSAERVQREFVQDRAGVRVCFTVSNHALRKCPLETQALVSELLDERSP